MPEPAQFATVLIANRGEIACRILCTLRTLAITGVAVHTEADARARHVREADVAFRIGSYLSISDILDAAAATGAQAIHPGYGFLAENADFARACADAGMVFIGPPAQAIALMGDKISAKRTVSAAGVAVVAGRAEPGLSDADLVAAATDVGYPVLIKPSAGGGGKGMHVVHSPVQLPGALLTARREAAASFGDDTLFLERFVHRPRHIEVQVLADAHGHVLALGERECSLQRRHQKIIEEAPSPLLDPATRSRIGAAACETARACGYTGAGTVEFIVSADDPEQFFFMEMNTRLQVEHPVTELVTGVDLVAEQLRVAAGFPLSLTQDDVVCRGHAIEARVYAETATIHDGQAMFLPTGGTVLALREPTGPGIRVDSGLMVGTVVGADYDPMLAKVIAHAPDRATALARLDAALAGTAVLGVGTNISVLRALLVHPQVQAGQLDTGLVDRELAALVDTVVPVQVPLGFALYSMAQQHSAARQRSDDVWAAPTGWRIGEPAPLRWRTSAGDVELRGDQASVDGGQPVAVDATMTGAELVLTVDGRTHRFLVATQGGTLWLGRGGSAWAVTELPPQRSTVAATSAAEVRSLMPGTVLAVAVQVGQQVDSGEPLVVVEAMKMEHTIRAPHAGTVTTLDAQVGAR